MTNEVQLTDAQIDAIAEAAAEKRSRKFIKTSGSQF